MSDISRLEANVDKLATKLDGILDFISEHKVWQQKLYDLEKNNRDTNKRVFTKLDRIEATQDGDGCRALEKNAIKDEKRAVEVNNQIEAMSRDIHLMSKNQASTDLLLKDFIKSLEFITFMSKRPKLSVIIIVGLYALTMPEVRASVFAIFKVI